jgi:sugar lactone lactonase YvrE
MKMRLLPAVLLTFATSWIASGQTYTISTFAGGGLPGNIPGTSASLYGPQAVAVDRAGNIFFGDGSDVLRLDAATGVLTLVAGNGTPGLSGDNGPATSAQLHNPTGVAVDSAGNLYIADQGDNRIRKVTNGVITTVAGTGPMEPSVGTFGGDGGPATSAQLNFPSGVAVDSAGNLYIADLGNDRIRKVSNGVSTTVAGNGTQGFSGDDGPATSAELSVPNGVAVGSAGNIYIADSGNSRIRILTPTGSSCTYVVAPTSLQVPAAGGNLTLSIQTTASCPWALSGLPSWITVASATSGTISATVSLAVAANPGQARSATIAVASVSVQVTQQGGYLPCTYALSPSDQTFPVAGGTGSVTVTATVTATNGCSWTASSDVSWVTFTGSTSGTGNGTVTYQVAANTGGARSGNLSVAGLPFVVQQSGTVIAPANMAGNWQFSARSTMFGLAFSVTGQIAQTGNSVSGQLSITGTPCATTATFTGTLSSSGALAMNLNENGQAVVFSGTLAPDGNSGSGSYSAASGGCTNGDRGIWSGQRVSTSTGIVGGVISTVAGNGTQGFGGDGGPAISAVLDNPSGVAVDSAGNVYMADSNNERIRRVSTSGTITTVAGNGKAGFSGDGGPVTAGAPVP